MYGEGRDTATGSQTGPKSFGAVLVLAGGSSRRLGTSKAWLAWDDTPLLIRILERLSPLAERTIVAARPGQALPDGRFERVDDDLPGAGPLAALAAGLARVAADDPAARVAVSACDYPFADPNLLAALAVAAPQADVVLPRWQGELHPLQAVWRAAVASRCAHALGEGTRRVRDLIARLDGVVVDAAGLAGVLAPGRALLNLNDPADLDRAREWARKR
ncbi:MAG TPA: molybdenum cofactor guanylyltransferase [Gemmatimonadota bacterium]|nr:molybdenum cofactor guanylyltransferase [Gemmatimonadota bacterium]